MSNKGHREERIKNVFEIKKDFLTKDSMTNLLDINGSLYIATKTDLKYFDHVKKRVFNVSGYGDHKGLVRAKAMKNP